MFLVDAEHDGLPEPIAALLQEGRDGLRDERGAIVDHQGTIEIPGVVDAVFDCVSGSVQLAEFGAVAFDVPVDVDLDDLVGCQEAVADALPQRIGEDRRPEIIGVGDVFGLLRGRREADLRGCREVVEDLAPSRVRGRAAAVAFVDDDEVEEARRELAKQLLVLLRSRDGLVEAEIDLVGRVDAALLVEPERKVDRCPVLPLDGLGLHRQLRHLAREGPEVVDHRLVDENVAIGQEEDAFLATGLHSRQMIWKAV